jgi:mono/diheme cytochrome c family protein
MLSDVFPVPVTRETLQRGQERYNIYCAVCHGANGHGNGMIVQRGFPAPPSFHSDRLRQAPPGHFYYVMTRGYGVMYSYASRVVPEDRWAIAAYIRALQLSHGATTNDVPPAERGRLLTSVQ